MLFYIINNLSFPLNGNHEAENRDNHFLSLESVPGDACKYCYFFTEFFVAKYIFAFAGMKHKYILNTFCVFSDTATTIWNSSE